MTTTDDNKNEAKQTAKQPAARKTKIKTLQQKIHDADPAQAKRFGNLRGESLDIATEGILRIFAPASAWRSTRTFLL